jgi:multiple sugar transport system substrate-binding protein
VQVQLAGGVGPDILQCSPAWFRGLVRKDLLVQLDQLVARESSSYVRQVLPNVLEASQVDGKLYGLPVLGSPVVLGANRSLFETAGLKPPPTSWDDASWNWESLAQSARQLTRFGADGAAEQFGFDIPGTWEGPLNTLIMQNGGQMFSKDLKESMFDRPEAYEAIQWQADLRHRQRVAVKPEENPGGAISFVNGRIGMSYRWSTSVLVDLDTIKDRFDYNIFAIPRGRKQTTHYHNSGMVVFATAKHREAAWRLASYIGNPAEGDAESLKLGKTVPMTKEGEQHLFAQFRDRINVSVVTEAMKHATAFVYPTVWSDVAALIAEAFNPVFAGQVGAREAAQSIKPKIDAVLRSPENS